jgi:hypothetical protein
MPLLTIIKPQIALPVMVMRLHIKGMFLALGVLFFSLLMYPSWPLRWLSLIGDYEAIYPFRAPLGLVLLFSAFLIRYPKGRLLFLTALLPFRTHYDLLPLAFVPSTGRQMELFTLASWLYLLSPFVVGIENAPITLHLFCLVLLLVG